MIKLQVMLRKYSAPILAVIAIMQMPDCGSSAKVVTFKTRLLFEADSLFYCGDYRSAREKYAKVSTVMPRSNEARAAQYNLAYLDVFYKNEDADWDTALKEFKTFATLYPKDHRTGEALSWIRLLTVIKSFDNEFKRASHQVESLKLFKDESRTTKRFFLDSIASVLHSCYQGRDSLVKKNKELENVIIELEKKYLKASQ